MNPYARRYQILSLARLPFRHLRIDNIVAYSQTTGPTRSRRERGVRSVGCVGRSQSGASCAARDTKASLPVGAGVSARGGPYGQAGVSQ